jgi:phosphoserine phosphatase
MKYKIIIFDIDGTITRHVSSWQMIHENFSMWDELAEKYQRDFNKGKISYKKFCRLDALCWKGMPEKNIENIFRKVDYARNAKPCIRMLKKKGFRLAAVSTGLQYTAEIIKRELAFDLVMSNRLLSKNGLLTGGIKINISHGAKGIIVKKILRHFMVKPHEAIGIGDSAGDIPLAKNTGYFIAFNSSDTKLSSVSDYNCLTNDFKEAYDKIMEQAFR